MSIKLENISKSFKKDCVLDRVSLDVARGETLVLFGPSGAGKTVLLRLIAGVIEPDSGFIEVNGYNMDQVAPEDRGVGMAFQNFALFPHMDAFDNISSPLTALKKSRSDISVAVHKLSRLLKIDHVLDHKPSELSNGQKQRTSLARAMAGQPSVLLLDDPLRNVDAKLRFEMRLELPRILKRQKTTVIYVTQDYKEAMALGDHIAVMNSRGIAQYGTPESIYHDPDHRDIARLFGDPVINLLEGELTATKGKEKESDVQLDFCGHSLQLGEGYKHVIGRKCTVGIRPELMQLHHKKSAGCLQVSVQAETPLNEKVVDLICTENGQEIMVSRPANSAGPQLSQAYLQINPWDILLFDANTGIRIRPQMTDVVLEGAA